jgi:DNA modification methylase
VSDNPITAARNRRADKGIVGAAALHSEVYGQSGQGGFERAKIDTRNARNVWSINTVPFHGAHFATMPPALARRCIAAGCPRGGQVLDPFGGAGTTGLVAAELGRTAALIELNIEYAILTKRRLGHYLRASVDAHQEMVEPAEDYTSNDTDDKYDAE